MFNLQTTCSLCPPVRDEWLVLVMLYWGGFDLLVFGYHGGGRWGVSLSLLWKPLAYGRVVTGSSLWHYPAAVTVVPGREEQRCKRGLERVGEDELGQRAGAGCVRGLRRVCRCLGRGVREKEQSRRRET